MGPVEQHLSTVRAPTVSSREPRGRGQGCVSPDKRTGRPEHGDEPTRHARGRADFDGDLQDDLAFTDSTTGEWFVRRSFDAGLTKSRGGKCPNLMGSLCAVAICLDRRLD
jgi:hypothetical protein